jgi:DNA repair protein RecO (recombination protein O)
MDASTVYLQPAFILQHRPYRETSILLEVFTRDYGIVSVLAKGVRKAHSKTAGLLLPFSQLRLSYLDKHELKVLSQVEYANHYPLQNLGLYCGFYINELLQKFLHKYDPHPQLFVYYQDCLQALLKGDSIEQTLRYFELDLLEEAGYAVELDVEQDQRQPVQGDQRYLFIPGVGMIADNRGDVSGETLLALATKSPLSGEVLAGAKSLLRKMLDEHLQGKPLKSREVLANIIKYL